jgi:hypothetical protein
MRGRATRNALSALVAITVLGGCAHANGNPSEISTKNQRITIQVANHNWQDVAIWANSGGTRIRLGTVTTGTTERFRLPQTISSRADNVQLEAHRIGSADDTYYSDVFMVTPGTRLVWTIENQIGLSSQYISGR